MNRIVKNQNYTQIIQMALDGFYDHQTGHELNISNGLSQFSRLIDGKHSYEVMMRLEPKTNIEIFNSTPENHYILQIAAMIKCGTGSMKTDCGAGLSGNFKKPFSKGNGHYVLGMRYEHYRDTDITEYYMNINQYLFNRQNIQLNTDLRWNEKFLQNITEPKDYSIGSELRMMF